MAWNLDGVEHAYDTIAGQWAEAFADEHEKKPKDQEVLRRFAREIGPRRPVWELGCGVGNTARYLKGLGVDVSGLDLSDGMLAQARALHPGIRFHHCHPPERKMTRR
jgi:predicted TPR repeat methyltransferase